jgi:hypothetical protein
VAATSLVNFADVVEADQSAVVNIDATTKGASRAGGARAGVPDPPELFDGPFGFGRRARTATAPLAAPVTGSSSTPTAAS